MVEDRAAEGFGGAGEAAGCTLVAVARRRIAAGVIMREEDRGGRQKGCVRDDRSQREVGAGLVAAMAAEMEAARIAVEMRNPQGLGERIALSEAAGEEAPCSCEAVECQRRFGTLMKHANALSARARRSDQKRVRLG